MPAASYAPLDEALDIVAPYGIALKNGNSNHAPMAAEALCALGRPEAVLPWVARYRERMLPRPPAGERIAPDDWRGALGRRERFADWAEFFAEALREAPWRRVLDKWLGRLTPGFCAAATHGVIRVGHAARGLAAGETPSRRRELADALASWAATYQELPTQELPTAPGGRAGRTPPRRAIAETPRVPTQDRPSGGNIVSALATLSGLPGFAEAIWRIDTEGAIAPLVAELTELFARVYLANAHDVRTGIAFIHGVTSVAALGNIAGEVDEATARAALPYAWQAGCGLYACFGGATPFAEAVAPTDASEAALIDRAIAHGDEHVIKFTEACLHRRALAPSPAYLAAAAHVSGVIPRR